MTQALDELKIGGLGASRKRVEDDRFIRGKGNYTDDITLPGMLHMEILRSPLAHARIKKIDASKAWDIPGVRLVLTGAEVAHLGPLPTPGVLPDVDIKIPAYPILARDVVRYVGDAVAFIVADTLAVAKDAAEAIAIDWQPLPHVTGGMEALKKGAPQVWPGASSTHPPPMIGVTTTG